MVILPGGARPLLPDWLARKRWVTKRRAEENAALGVEKNEINPNVYHDHVIEFAVGKKFADAVIHLPIEESEEVQN